MPGWVPDLKTWAAEQVTGASCGSCRMSLVFVPFLEEESAFVEALVTRAFLSGRLAELGHPWAGAPCRV